MRARVKKPTPPAPEAPELCVVIGCESPCGPGLPACSAHFGAASTADQVGYFEAAAEALNAPDVQRARRDARNRLALALRGVRT